VAVNDVMACLADPLTAVTPNAATIRRKTYTLGGQPVATHANGYPAGETGKNGLFYMHSDTPYGMLTVDGAALLNGYPYRGAEVLEFDPVSRDETKAISNQVQQQLRTYLGK
jgi:hypothetical protein